MSLEPTSGRISDKLGYLSAQDIFKDLYKEEIEWLDRITVQITCEKGRTIYSPGQSGEVLYLLKKGKVELYRLSLDGRKLVTARLGEQTFFGEMSLWGQGMYDSFAEALTDCVLCAMSRSDVERLLLTKPIVGLRVLQVIGKRLLDANSTLEELAFKRLAARVAALLLRLSQEQGNSTVSGLTHHELAEMVGSTRETVTQVLNDMKAQGLLDIGRGHLCVLDSAGLQRVAEGG